MRKFRWPDETGIFLVLPAEGCGLAETARVIRPGGRVAILEVDAPRSTLLRTGYDIWFNKVVPRLGAALSDREAYEYLPRSVAYLPATPVLRSSPRKVTAAPR